MNKLNLLLLVSLLHSGEAITCYFCSSDPNVDIYDPECATNGYDGHKEEHALKYSCYTDVYEDGRVDRFFDPYIHGNGECVLEYDTAGNNLKFWRCYCDTNQCNNNNCEHCYGTSTQSTTTVGTEMTTYHPDKTTTNEHSTTKSTDHPEYTTTSPNPSQGLTCYGCLDCPTVDANTNYVTDGDFQTCVTAVLFLGSHASVMRSGDYDLYLDGECIHQDGGIYCYCTTNLCNYEEYTLESAH